MIGARAGESRRFVFVSLEYPPAFGGGIGTFVAAMTRVLALHGHRVTVVTVTEESLPRREHLPIGPCGLEVVRVPLPRTQGAEPGVTVRTWQELSDRFSAYLSRLVNAEGSSIDAIEFPDYRGEALTFLSTTRAGERPPCVVRLHTPSVVLAKYNRSRGRHEVLEAFENDAIRMADRLVSPSRALAREVVEDVPWGAWGGWRGALPPIDILPHPVDPDFLTIDPERERRRLGIAPGDCGAEEILYVGRLEERKGVETLIGAAPEVLSACPSATLHLVGGDLARGPAHPSMLEHLRSMLPESVAERVVFHGRLGKEALVERYLRARVCVYPSLFENFPNTCLESMALARPTLGTDNSGMAEMMEHGVSGVITRAGDRAALTRDLIGLYNARAEDRAEMGRAARERVKALYAPDRIAEEYVRVLGDLRGEPLARPRPIGVSAPRRETVAVVIPCFNHGEFVEEAIESVRAQRRLADEIVVVDDGSTDRGTRAVLRGLDGRHGVRVIGRRNGGLAAARNTGIRATRAEFFVPLDADDLIEPEFIERLLAPLRDEPALGYAYSHVRYFGAHGGEWRCPEYDPRKLLVANLSTATALIRRSAYDQAGGYNESMRRGFEDWDLWLSLLDAGYHGACVGEPLFLYRKHAQGSMLGRTQMSRAEIMAAMIEQHADLFAADHAWALAEKDRMFFDAHMQAWDNLVALNTTRERLAWVEGSAHNGHGTPALNGTGARAARTQVEGKPGVFEGLFPPGQYRDGCGGAQQELERLLGSRFYRTVQRLKELSPYRAFAARRYGPDWREALEAGTPAERLDRIKASRGYRVIMTLKRTAAYRLWAGWRYGDGDE